MSRVRGQPPAPGSSPSSPQTSIDDWEEWEDDDDVVTPINTDEEVLIDSPDSPGPRAPSRAKRPVSRSSRPPSTKIQRLKSRQRQRAQNAKAGIKVITDMTNIRLQQNNIAGPLGAPRDRRPVKFVDAAALRALEGEPSSASVGNWNWLKRSVGKASPTVTPQSSSARSPPQELTPGDAPIMIGITMPPEDNDDADERGIGSGSNGSTPTQAKAFPGYPPGRPNPSAGASGSSATPLRQQETTPVQQVSMWSPDTPNTTSSKNSRVASSVYSQNTNAGAPGQATNLDVPPVPALPSNYTKPTHQRLISLDCGGSNVDSDDGGTPCTLFEEDGSPNQNAQFRGKGAAFTPDSAGSRSHGWWDHVVTPFMDKRFTFTSRRTRVSSLRDSPRDQHHQSPGGTDVDEKKPHHQLPPVPHASPPPVVRTPTPTLHRTPPPPSSRGNGDATESSSHPATTASPPAMAEKPSIMATSPEIPRETPPPYSPPRNAVNAGQPPVRYRAVFPPGHPLQAQFPPSPGPVSPGLAATMTSQGATAMSDIPITPTAPREMPPPPSNPLPSRPMGASLPQEYSHDARGPEHRVERTRRRHEKEEALATKLGGFWRGRGCVPSGGCFGRPGREGRKRRRWWMAGLVVLLLVIVLASVLGVVLNRPADSPEVQSIWLNLTDFPPMPTGVLTVAGPDNTVARSGCTRPSTLWSCSLPKDAQDSVDPYSPDQPTVILEMQYDNSTGKQWDVPNGDPPQPDVSRRAAGASALAGSLVRQRRAKRFNPSPRPPDFEEMWFLGNTTDDVKSDEKAGEPTPFYISILDSLSDSKGKGGGDGSPSKRQTTVGGDLVRDLVSTPDLLDDGTPTPAQMLPRPVQQPVRLYDRGLPTEHYGFYTYFKRTIFLKSVDQDTGEGDVPLDENGGCSKSEANFLVTWSQTRMRVRVWTRKLGDEAKLLTRGGEGGIGGSKKLVRPGTMPYPVTVTLDTHGGDPEDKFVWEWPMDERQRVDEQDPKLLPNDISFGGEVINHRKNNDSSFGGFDGGTGGCKCEWVNWT